MVQILDILHGAADNFSLIEGLTLMKPLAIFILGMSVYSFFIFKLYRFIARRDVFKQASRDKDGTNREGIRKFFAYGVYIFKHIFFLPIIIFFWFVALSVILAFLSRQDSIQIVLLISIALIATIRVMAYYNEDLSKDLAKMLPFALLGIFLVDISFFSAENSLNTIYQIPGLWNILIYYFIFLILLEIILRSLFGIFNWFSKIK